MLCDVSRSFGLFLVLSWPKRGPRLTQGLSEKLSAVLKPRVQSKYSMASAMSTTKQF